MMKYIFFSLLLLLLSVSVIAQDKSISELVQNSKKGDYAILEVRLNREDQFRTIEGNNSSLSRISLFLGTNTNNEVLSKNFNGFNKVLTYINQLSTNGWVLVNTYNLPGEALIVTHYVFMKKKK